MNERTSPYVQSMFASSASSTEAFVNELTKLSAAQHAAVVKDPLELIPMHSTSLVLAFAAHVHLCQQSWAMIYEPYANTSVVYGHAYHRNAVRQLTRRYNVYMSYIKHTLTNLEQFRMYACRSSDDFKALEPLIRDFGHFADEIGCLKRLCDQFLEQQVGKLALQDARSQMREARDLKRISYLAFTFVPLSLTASFFGMNVKELDSGPTSVWVFVVTALGILAGSFCVFWFSSLPLPALLKQTAAGFGKAVASIQRITIARPGEPDSQLPGSHSVTLRPKKWKWKFWQKQGQIQQSGADANSNWVNWQSPAAPQLSDPLHENQIWTAVPFEPYLDVLH